MTRNAIELRNISKTFYSYDRSQTIREKLFTPFRRKSKSTSSHKVLNNVNMNFPEGQFIGIMGKNGAGKSTLLKIIMGSLAHDPGGIIDIRGRIIRLALGLGIDQELTGRDNIYINGSIIGLSFHEIGEKFEEMVEFAGIRKFIDAPLKYYSTGMRSRIMFSIAIHADADILLLDEFFGGVGDTDYRTKSEKKFHEFIGDNKTIIHVSHSEHTIRKYCDLLYILHAGSVLRFNDVEEGIEFYKNNC